MRLRSSLAGLESFGSAFFERIWVELGLANWSKSGTTDPGKLNVLLLLGKQSARQPLELD